MRLGDDVWTARGGGVHLCAVSQPDEAVLPVPPEGTYFVGRLNGARMRDGSGVFEEFARSLRFPAYFGWNWPAFSECLRDLSWLPADGYLLVIANGDDLLVDEPEELSVLLRSISTAVGHWSSSLNFNPDRDSAEIPFNVVCCVTPGNLPQWEARLGRQE